MVETRNTLRPVSTFSSKFPLFCCNAYWNLFHWAVAQFQLKILISKSTLRKQCNDLHIPNLNPWPLQQSHQQQQSKMITIINLANKKTKGLLRNENNELLTSTLESPICWGSSLSGSIHPSLSISESNSWNQSLAQGALVDKRMCLCGKNTWLVSLGVAGERCDNETIAKQF